MLLAVPKNEKNSLKKNYIHFLLDGDFFFFKLPTYMFEKAKGLNICKTILKIDEKIDEKMYLFSYCHVKKLL